MVRRRRGDSYLGGSTVIGRGGRWPKGGEINKSDPAGKRFSTVGGFDDTKIARIDAEKKATATRRMASLRLAQRQAQRDAMRARVRARAASLAKSIKRFWDEVMKVFRV